MQDFTHLRTNIIFVQAHLEESLINLLQIFSTSCEYLNHSSLLLQAQMDKHFEQNFEKTSPNFGLEL